MTVLGAFHRRPPLPVAALAAPARGSVAATLSAIVRRLADSPLDSSVLQAVGAPTASGGTGAAHRAVRMRASWRTATAPDGSRHLEAHWDPGR
ncbi:hypothetical protein ACIPLC_19035 [Kitasatospora sp. NPDC086801]|uniref:hypothetical protein n=1 Tax=Kitasatospora sp. NPDC086801 TaxID=3364066 RepID=UPI00381C7C18